MGEGEGNGAGRERERASERTAGRDEGREADPCSPPRGRESGGLLIQGGRDVRGILWVGDRFDTGSRGIFGGRSLGRSDSRRFRATSGGKKISRLGVRGGRLFVRWISDLEIEAEGLIVQGPGKAESPLVGPGGKNLENL